MAVSVGTFTVSSAVSYSYTVPSGTNRYGVLLVQEEYATAPTSITATIGGNSLTAVSGSPFPASAASGLWAFYILDANLPATGAQTVAITVTGGSGLQGRMSAMVIHSGAIQSAPTVTSTINQAGVATISIGPFNYTDGSMAQAGIMTGAGNQTSTESAGWTEAYDQADTFGDTAGAGATRVYSGSGSDTVVFTASTGYSNVSGVVLVIDAAGGGAPENVPFINNRFLTLTGIGT